MMNQTCANCSEAPAVVKCGSCRVLLCAKCDAVIHSNKIFSSHEREKIENQRYLFPSTCPKHGDLVLAVCNDCKEKCCMSCITESHLGHTIVKCEILSKKYADEFGDTKKSLEMFGDLGRSATAIMKSEIAALGESRDAVLGQIDKSFEAMTQQLRKKRDDMIKEVTEKTEEAKKALAATSAAILENCAKGEAILGEAEAKGAEGLGVLVAMENAIQNLGTTSATLLDAVQRDSIALSFAPGEDAKFTAEVNAASSLDVKPKYLSGNKNVLEVCMHTDESGRKKLEITETSAKVSWESVPQCIDAMVQKTAPAEYILEAREILLPGTALSATPSKPNDDGDDEWPPSCRGGSGGEGESPATTVVYRGKDTTAVCTSLEKGKKLMLRVRAVLQTPKSTLVMWRSNFLRVASNSGYPFEWKPCPSGISESHKYEVDKENSAIATQLNGSSSRCTNGCTIVATEPLPLGVVVSWKIRYIVAAKNGCCGGVGVAPTSIDQGEDRNVFKCGWYYNPFASVLRSGPPQKVNDKKYGPTGKDSGEVLKSGDEIEVTMDMIKGTLSFVIGGVDYGVAFEGIPLDKPLVPCVITGHLGDSVEIF